MAPPLQPSAYLSLSFLLQQTSCDENEAQHASRGTRSLWDHASWAFSHRDVIPFELSAESRRSCVEADDTRVELLGVKSSFAVSTSDCNYGYLAQPSLNSISAENSVTVRV